MKKYIRINVRIYPNNEQKELIDKTINCCRFFHNKVLEDRVNYYKEHKKFLNAKVSEYRKKYPWLKEIDSKALSIEKLNIDKAFMSFFAKRSKFPKFKKKKGNRGSFSTQAIKENVRIENNKIRFPKIEFIKFRTKYDLNIPNSRIMRGSITRNSSNKYYASILFEYEVDNQDTLADTNKYTEDNINSYKSIGLDFSMTHFYVDSEGNKAGNPKYFKRIRKRLVLYQRRASKCEFGSNNYKKASRKVSKLTNKISNQRRDYNHKLSHKLAESYDIVGIEDIKIKDLQKIKLYHFGSLTNDIGWYSFTQMLSYKLSDRGKRLVKVGKSYPSTQLCSNCGYKNEDLKGNLNTRKWICPKCGTHHDRDINAAINIKNEALRILIEE